MQTLRTIVVGTDFSECADSALETAVTLARASAARIVLVHVCALDAESAELETERVRRCEDALSGALARYRQCGVAIDAVLRHGRPWDKLANVVAEVGAGLVVIGRHGAGRSSRTEPGEVATRVIQAATRPVLIVPPALDLAR